MANNTLLANVPVDLLYQAYRARTEAGLVTSRDASAGKLGNAFIKAMAQHRHWEREIVR